MIAADEHGKTKDKLPERPRGPHPYPTALHFLAGSATAAFVAGAARMVAAHPHPHGTRLRVTVTVVDSGELLGQVDVDVTNLWDLGRFADRRATQTFETAPQVPRLQLLRGGS